MTTEEYFILGCIARTGPQIVAADKPVEVVQKTVGLLVDNSTATMGLHTFANRMMQRDFPPCLALHNSDLVDALAFHFHCP